MQYRWGAAAMICLGLAAAGCGRSGPGATLKAEEMGLRWPFTVPQVSLVCAPDMAIFVEAGGKAYPLNGQAERRPQTLDKATVGRLADIWKVDAEAAKLIPDARMSLEEVSRKAIDHCEKAGRWRLG